MDKKQLRQSTMQKLKTISVTEKEAIEQKLTETLFHSELWKQSKVIGITIAHHIEWNTTPMIIEAWNQNKIVCVPKCYPKTHDMIFYQIDSFDQLENQYHDLLEPNPTITEEITKEQIDLLVVPGLLFDKDGFRIGFGGGYYDRFLMNFPNVTLSLLNRSQLVDKIPSDAYDIPVNYLVVENKIMKGKHL